MKTRCLLIDDEPLALELLESHLLQMENFEIVAKVPNALKAMDVLKSKKIDLMFSDIKMPMITGIELIKALKNPPKTIITTAYREFALEGYELEIIDYLLKPITFERFFRAIEKFLRQRDQKVTPTLLDSNSQIITIKSNNKYHKVNLVEVLYIESQKDYIKLFLMNREITAKYKISDIETLLSGNGFIRVHRSFIVNKIHIHAFSATEIEVGKYTVPIGMSYKELLIKEL